MQYDGGAVHRSGSRRLVERRSSVSSFTFAPGVLAAFDSRVPGEP